MGNDNTTPDPLGFYNDADTEELFAILDYQLKDGMHIQDRHHQLALFDFLNRNEKSLIAYYTRYFGVNLSVGGVGKDRYYYLEFNGADRGGIDGEHRYFLKPEYVIIGFLIHKIIFIDRNFEIESVKKLQLTIQTDYEELKDDLYRLLARLRRTSSTELGDNRVAEIVYDALKEFKKLGWVILDEDFFDVMPSFHRLNKIYSDHISNFEELIKSNP
jgi:hypothetical protein